MLFIRDWTYKHMVKRDTGKSESPLLMLLFWIVVLGIIIDWCF